MIRQCEYDTTIKEATLLNNTIMESVKNRLNDREEQLKDMAVQLACHLEELDDKDRIIDLLLFHIESTQKQLAKTEQNLHQHLLDKVLLLEQLEALEFCENPQSPQPSGSPETDFYMKLQDSSFNSGTKQVPVFPDSSEDDVFFIESDFSHF